MTEPAEPGGRHAAPGGPSGWSRPPDRRPTGDTRPLPVLAGGSAGPAEGGPAPAHPVGEPVGRVRRFWSPRRLPAGITALLALGGLGLLLYDVSAVRSGRRAMPWRVRLADELATRQLDDVWVLTGAAVAAVLGLWLVLLALTPGLRQVLPMRPGPGRIRAGLDREAAALALRDRALEVPGVQTVRVSVGRRRARVRADSHFRELDEVRADVADAVEEAGRGFRLEHPLRLSVAVRRAWKG
jgi:Family of unknown function (DUF6286)